MTLPHPLPSLLLAALLAVTTLPAGAAQDGADIAVHVEKDGGSVRVQVDCPVRAPAAVAWDVLTDYDNMAKFVTNLTQSSVRMRMGNRAQVHQKGKASRGPLSIAFENVREIEFTPQTEIRSRIVSGEPMPAEFVTRIEERDGQVHVVHHGHYTPSVWVPPGIGPAIIESETRKQYAEIRAEIERRTSSAKGVRAGGG
ncbi:MAG: SRPBCC family protein [Burkholderiales bacterium]